VSSRSGHRRRNYQMSKRAQLIDDTRARIVAATVELHGTIGPAGTTVMGIAAKAGVTRATVYRHFPDEAALFDACSKHWLAQQTPSDPSLWANVPDPILRVKSALSDLYRFYKAGEPMLTRIYRDKESLPKLIQENLEAQDRNIRDILLAGFQVRGKERRQARAALGHSFAFSTWRSLCVEQALENEEAVDLMVQLIRGVPPET
jgi:AcrR family transcriptional regulator